LKIFFKISSLFRKEDDIRFYGGSFIANQTGARIVEANETDECFISAEFDLDELRRNRAAWGLFRDRRPELYYPLTTLDGNITLKSAPSTTEGINWRMPAEWIKHERCWMLWPRAYDDSSVWVAGVDVTRKAFSEVVNAIAKYEVKKFFFEFFL